MTSRRLIAALAVVLGADRGRRGAAGANRVTAPAPIAEIRVHGNHSTPDAEVIAASGLAVGQPSGDAEPATPRANACGPAAASSRSRSTAAADRSTIPATSWCSS